MPWSWFRSDAGKLSTKRHELQTFVDTIAYAENISLRILDMEKLCELSAVDLWRLGASSYACENAIDSCTCEGQLKDLGERLKKVFENAQNISSKPDNENNFDISLDIKDTETLRRIDRKIWLNLPSNPWPLQSLLRLSDEWRWFILLWFYLHREEIGNKAISKEVFPAFYMDNLWEFHFRPIRLDCNSQKEKHRYILVIGPLYKPATARTARIFHKEQGVKFIRCVSGFFEAFAKKSLTRKPRDETIERALLARRPFSPSAVMERIEAIEFQFKSVLKLSSAESPAYRYSEYFALTRAFVAIERWPGKLVEEIGPTSSLPVSLSFRFVLPPPCDRDFQIKATLLDSKTLECESAQWIQQSPSIINSTGVLPSFLCGLELEKPDSAIFIHSSELAIDRLNLRLERWDERIHEQRHVNHIERLNMLLDWLHDHTGEFSKKSGTNHRRLHDYICNHVLEGLRADHCHLYRLNHSDDTVHIDGAAYSRTELHKYRADIAEILEHIPQDKKAESLVYRCIRYNRVEYVEKPTGSNLFIGDKIPEKFHPKSGIAAPISFQGRIFGVLEVTGLVKNQFQWTHQHYLAAIAARLAEYLYIQELLVQITQITGNALHIRASDTEASSADYTRLAEAMTRMFLCRNAFVWLRDPYNRNRFLLKGLTDQELWPEAKDGSISLDIEKTDITAPSTVVKLFKLFKEKGQSYLVGKIDYQLNESQMVETDLGYLILGRDYIDARPHRRKYEVKGFDEIMTFLLCSPGQSEKEMYGFVTLLNGYYSFSNAASSQDKHPVFIGFPPVWQNVVDLVNEHLMMVLNTLQAIEIKEDTHLGLLRHEIKQDAWSLIGVKEETLEHSRRLRRIETVLGGLLQDPIIRERLTKGGEIETKDNRSGRIIFSRDDELSKTISDIHTVAAHLENMHRTASLLRNKVNLWEIGKSFDVRRLYGNDAPNFGEPEMEVPIYETIQDVFHQIKKAKEEKGLYIDFGNIGRNNNSLRGRVLKMQPSMFRNFLKNIFDNAVKYSDPHSAIDIEFKYLSREKGYVLMVSNLGPKLNDDELNIPFFEAGMRASFALKLPGEGLGLYIVSLICKLHGIKYSWNFDRKESSFHYHFVFTFPRYMVSLLDDKSY